MIAIVNQQETNNKGETKYHLKINSTMIVEFWHNKELGMDDCLKKAIEELEKHPNIKAPLNDIHRKYN